MSTPEATKRSEELAEREEELFSNQDFLSTKASESETPWKNDASAFIYFIGCGKFIKVGIARDIEKRLQLLQIGNPYPLKILRSFLSANPQRDEERLHNALERFHARGEWFEIGIGLLEALINEAELEMIGPMQKFRRKKHKVETPKVPPTRRVPFVLFTVLRDKKIVYAGSVGQRHMRAHIEIRQSRACELPSGHIHTIQEAIRRKETEVIIDDIEYRIEFRKRPTPNELKKRTAHNCLVASVGKQRSTSWLQRLQLKMLSLREHSTTEEKTP